MKPTPEDLQALIAARYMPSRERLVQKPGYTRETGNEKIPSLRGDERVKNGLPMSLAGGAR